MKTLTVDDNAEVLIPSAILASLGVGPGGELQVFEFDGRIELVAVRPIREMRGFLRGMDSVIEQEEDRF